MSGLPPPQFFRCSVLWILVWLTCYLITESRAEYLEDRAKIVVIKEAPSPAVPPTVQAEDALFAINESGPHLSGQHFVITVVATDDYVNVQDNEDGSLEFSGYLVDILKELAREDRGNFTYELRTPSGYGAGCNPRLTWDPNNATQVDEHGETLLHPETYAPEYRTQFLCGEADTNEAAHSGTGLSFNNIPPSVKSDFYWAIIYITPERLLKNKFLIPYQPPTKTTLVMMGAVTHIIDIPDLVENYAGVYKVCGLANTAYLKSLQVSFPQLAITGIVMESEDSAHENLADGTCDIVILPSAGIPSWIYKYAQEGKCLIDGMVRSDCAFWSKWKTN